MHENLKFNVSLKKINKWQPIIATEYIGTFYMIYMKLCNEVKETDGVATVNCKFYIQNYRGSIKMGLGDPKNIIVNPELKSETGFDYTLEIPVIPFYNCNEPKDEVTLEFPLGLIPDKTIFETEIIHQELPDSIFNPKDLINSRFIHPLYAFREGDNINHIYYKKNVKTKNDTGIQQETSEITGGFYDSSPLKDEETSKSIKIKERKNSINDDGFGFGAKYSPTCDAKRTDIID